MSAEVYKRFQKILTESMYLILAHFLCIHVPVSGTSYRSSLIAAESQTCCYLAYYFLLTCGTTFKVNIVGILLAIEVKT